MMEEEKINIDEEIIDEAGPQDIEAEDNEEDVDVLKQSLLEERIKAEEYLANWQRAQADFINYKRRNEKEKSELGEYTKSAFALNILPVLDDFERAVSAVPQDNADTAWVEGIIMIERKLRSTLESEGLSSIEALGEPFDPNLHEAVRQDSGEEGIIIEDIRKGYRFRDRVIRPSQVVVGNGEIKEE